MTINDWRCWPRRSTMPSIHCKTKAAASSRVDQAPRCSPFSCREIWTPAWRQQSLRSSPQLQSYCRSSKSFPFPCPCPSLFPFFLLVLVLALLLLLPPVGPLISGRLHGSGSGVGLRPELSPTANTGKGTNGAHSPEGNKIPSTP